MWKNNFLRAIASLEKPTSGKLTVNGSSPEDARKNRAYGYVFQAAGLYPWRNIYRNVSLPLEIMGYKKNEIPGIVEKVLNLVDLTGFEKISLAVVRRNAAKGFHCKSSIFRC